MQTPNLAHYSSYAESAIIPTANLMLNYILKPVRHPSFFKKYAAKKFMKVPYSAYLVMSRRLNLMYLGKYVRALMGPRAVAGEHPSQP